MKVLDSQKDTVTPANDWIDIVNGPGTRVAGCGRKPTVTHWRRQFTPQQQLLYFIVEHSAHGEVDGESVNLHPGDLLWVAPRVSFDLQLVNPHKPIILYHLRFEVAGNSGRRFMIGRDMWHVTEAFDQLLDEWRYETALRPQRVRASLSMIFCVLFNEAAYRQGERTFTQSQRNAIYAFVDDKWHLRLTAADLAAQVGLSPIYFTRVFRQTFGLAPRPWLKRERIRHAATLLRETNVRVFEVARRFGYENPFLFSRQFHEVMGCGPRDYRRRQLG